MTAFYIERTVISDIGDLVCEEQEEGMVYRFHTYEKEKVIIGCRFPLDYVSS